MKSLVLVVVVWLVSGCTHYTRYRPDNGIGGYSTEKVDDVFRVSRFNGNSQTSPKLALLYSKVRAIEECKNEGFKVARILGSRNKSLSSTITRSSFVYSGFGTAHGETWDETTVYPSFDTKFLCANSVSAVNALFRVVTAEDMKTLVKDLKGAVQVEEKVPGSDDALVVGDIVIKANGQRVETIDELVFAIETGKNKSVVSLVVLREGEKIDISVKTTDRTAAELAENAETLALACKFSDVAKLPICGGSVTEKTKPRGISFDF